MSAVGPALPEWGYEVNDTAFSLVTSENAWRVQGRLDVVNTILRGGIRLLLTRAF